MHNINLFYTKKDCLCQGCSSDPNWHDHHFFIQISDTGVISLYEDYEQDRKDLFMTATDKVDLFNQLKNERVDENLIECLKIKLNNLV